MSRDDAVTSDGSRSGEPERSGATRSSAREPAIDALRGFALLGIAVVNVPWIGSERSLGAMLVEDALREALPWWELATAALVEWLAEGKFYPQFAALFGFGAGVMMSRNLAAQTRRLVVLGVFGLLHSAFGWWGDILLNYSVLGILLLALHKAPPRVVFGFALVVYALASVTSFLFDEWLVPASVASAETLAYRAENLRLYASAGFWEISAHRWEEAVYGFFLQWNWAYRLNTVAMGAFGLFVQRAGLLDDLAGKRPMLRRAALVLVPVGLGLCLVPQLYVPGGDVLAIGWATLFLWVATGPGGAALVRAFSPLGRCAISGYLGQTAVFTLVFYAYGLALYGQLGPVAMLGLGLGTWLLETLLARAWLARFELGPVEWLWRSLTYVRAMPLARRPT